RFVNAVSPTTALKKKTPGCWLRYRAGNEGWQERDHRSTGPPAFAELRRAGTAFAGLRRAGRAGGVHDHNRLGFPAPRRRVIKTTWVLVVLFQLVSSVRAQDALRSALSVEPLIQRSELGPVNLQPDRPHLGPVQLTLGAYGGLELNDNVNTSEQNPQSDLLL